MDIIKKISRGEKSMKKRILSIFLVCAMVVGLTACSGGGSATETVAETQISNRGNENTLVVGCGPIEGEFSPFFAQSSSDYDAQGMTQVSLLTTDRKGSMIYHGIEGETRNYNGTDYTYHGIADMVITENEDGTVFYDFKLRDDIKFSDGEPLTADDVIFSMYVLCDPTYDGGLAFASLPIEGLEEYRGGMEIRWKLIAEAGSAGYIANEFYTEEQYHNFWNAFYATGEALAQEIVDFCIANDYGTDVAMSAEAWGFEGLTAEATVADFFDIIAESYGYDMIAMDAEAIDMQFSMAVLEAAGKDMLEAVETAESASCISGIQKIDDHNVRVVMTEADATSIYQLAIQVAPLHYYGEETMFDVSNHSFGFPKGDLSLVREKTTVPMGAGPYKFLKFENGVIHFEANENYFLGQPKTTYINFLETQEENVLSDVITKTIDIGNLNYDLDTIAEIKTANGLDENNEEISGDVITVETVEDLAYGYIGINADAMKVGEERDSKASKNLRKAFATIFSVYRDVAVDSYYGESASVINYPISNTSWAAPMVTEADYEVAFSKDINGKDIYTQDMSAEAKYAAAKEAALSFFEGAGFTVENGKIVAAPEGKTMDYEIFVVGEGVGDHASFTICTMAKEALAEMGINLSVSDVSSVSEVIEGLRNDTCEMFCLAWSVTIDPDMTQIYHSTGTSNYCYDIMDEKLDSLIWKARTTTNQTERKNSYKQCLDIIMDWAVEVPVYQRKNAVVFSTKQINVETVTKDITPFYTWLQEIHNVELK